MPSWGDDEGRFWWGPPGVPYYEEVQIPHAPVSYRATCRCACCKYKRKQRGEPEPQTEAERIVELEAEVERLKKESR